MLVVVKVLVKVMVCVVDISDMVVSWSKDNAWRLLDSFVNDVCLGAVFASATKRAPTASEPNWLSRIMEIYRRDLKI